jgi:uncharacterized protein with beta-barrel porin domain
MQFGTTNLKADSGIPLWQSLFYNEIGGTLANKSQYLQPFLGLEAGYYCRDNIKEHGADSFNLLIKNKHRFTFNSRLGFHFFAEFSSDTTISADIAWKHRFSSSKEVLESAFAGFGDEFTIWGVKKDHDIAEGSLYISKQFNKCVRLYTDLFGQISSRYSAYGISGGISMAW